MQIKLGIQGNFGSMNQAAAEYFINKNTLTNAEILPLITTQAVLSALTAGEIQYGTFAYESSRAGVVAETKKALEDFKVTKIDQVTLQIDHVLLANSPIENSQTINIYSHPQAIKEHKDLLSKKFSKVNFIESADTASSAKELKEGQYLPNSLVIAPRGCAKLYGLEIYLDKLPSNEGYFTTFWLVRC